MNAQKHPASPERLLLGLATGLAVSLCLLEYGNPLRQVVDMAGWHYDRAEIEEDIPVVVFEKKPELPKPRELQPQKRRESASFVVVPDEVVVEEGTDSLPDFDIDETVDALTTKEVAKDVPLLFVQERPEFPGGESALFEFLYQNLRYPREARENGIEGPVYVQFVIGRDGAIDPASIEVLSTPHVWLSREALRVIRQMPRWKPGIQQGHPVPVYVQLPVRFTLKY